MIVLDTNVLSEEMRPTPEPAVHGWLARQNPLNLFTTAVNFKQCLQAHALTWGNGYAEIERRSGTREPLSMHVLHPGRDVSWICSPGASCRSTARRRASSPGS